MGVDKVILRAIFSTLAAIGALILFMALSLCLFFPSTMMELSYGLGLERSSIRFAERAYASSEDVYYIAYATEVAIEEDDQGKIIVCAEKLIRDERFDEYCAQKNDNYKQIIYGKLCIAKYSGGERDEAIAIALEGLGEGRFPDVMQKKSNAMVSLALKALETKDTEMQAKLKTALQGLRVEDAAERKCLTDTLSLLP